MQWASPILISLVCVVRSIDTVEQRGLIVSFFNLAGVTRRHFTIYLTVFLSRLEQFEEVQCWRS